MKMEQVEKGKLRMVEKAEPGQNGVPRTMRLMGIEVENDENGE
jgi:hypothetical protein